MTEGLIFYANVSDKTHGEGATFAARHMNDEKLTPFFSHISFYLPKFT